MKSWPLALLLSAIAVNASASPPLGLFEAAKSEDGNVVYIMMDPGERAQLDDGSFGTVAQGLIINKKSGAITYVSWTVADHDCHKEYATLITEYRDPRRVEHAKIKNNLGSISSYIATDVCEVGFSMAIRQGQR